MATYSREQLMTALRNADAAGDTPAAKRIAQMVKGLDAEPTPQQAQQAQQVPEAQPVQQAPEAQPEPVQQAPEAQPEPVQQAQPAMQAQQPQPYQMRTQQPQPYSYQTQPSDAVQAPDMETRATRELPELPEAAGLLSGYNIAEVAPKVAAITTMTDPQEIADTLSTFPDIGIQYDEKGNVIVARNTPQGPIRAVINKPGISGMDIINTLGLGLMLAPANKATGVMTKALVTAAESGARSAAVQAAQEQVGGEFDVGEVLLDVALAGGAEFIPSVIKASKGRAERGLTQAVKESDRAVAAATGQPIEQASEDVARDVATQAGAKTQDAATVREIVVPQRETIEAAERLGVAEQLTPAQVSGSQAYREVEGALSAVPGSQLNEQRKQAISSVSQKADDLIEEFGGKIDSIEASESVRNQISSTVESLTQESESIYREIDNVIPKNTKVNGRSLSNYLKGQAEELGGIQNLDPIERKILNMAESNPTYSLLDRERKRIGAALRKSEGPYKDADTAMLKNMYSKLTQLQEGVADTLGAGDLWKTAKSVVSQRKQLEEDSIVLLGKKLTDAIVPKVGRATKKLAKGDFKEFDTLMSRMPKENQQEVVLSALNDVFTAGSRKEKQLSVNGFVDWYAELSRNAGAKRRLFKYMPEEAQKRLDDIYAVSKGIRSAESERVRTGVVQTVFKDIEGAGSFVGKIYNIGKQILAAEGATSMAGIPGAGTASVLTNVLGRSSAQPLTKAADKMIASHEFRSAMRNFAKSDEKAIASRAAVQDRLRKSEMYQQWYNLLPSDSKQRIAEAGLMAWLNEGDES